MFSLIRNQLITWDSSVADTRRSPAAVATRNVTTGLLVLIASMSWGSSARAQSVLPSGDLNFQTSGIRRCANIGDWYTTGGLGPGGDNPNCAQFVPGSPPGSLTIGAPGFHTFFVNITQTDLDNGGGSVVITIEDAESNGNLDESFDDPDPTRFSLLLNDVELSSEIFDETDADGTNFDFPPINTPGVYEVRSETGAFHVFDNGDDTIATNNDDNSFQIIVPVDNLLIGQLQGSFQQDTGSSVNTDLFFLVGPDVVELFLRNFDLDGGGQSVGGIPSYEDPDGGVTIGTTSGNQSWNGNGDLNNGGDTINVVPIEQAGRWTFALSNYTSRNQTILEANAVDPVTGALIPVPLLDQPPLVAGNFTITPDTVRTTTIGVEVCHPFTVTNNFFTSDIVNLSLSGTDPNYTVELRDAAGTTPLTDTDGDGLVDTGILATGIPTGTSQDFTLCVTPEVGAPSEDNTIISGTSFMDVTIRQQAVADGLPGADPNPDIQSVTKTTLIPEIGLAKSIPASSVTPVPGQPGLFNFEISYVVANTGGGALENVQVTDDLQTVFVDAPTFQGGPGNGADSFTVQSVTVNSFSGSAADAPIPNPNFDGDADQNLFTTDPNTFAEGDFAVVTVALQVDLSSDGILEAENSAEAVGTDIEGDPITDVSQDISDLGDPNTVTPGDIPGLVDEDGDGDPTNDSDASPVQIPLPDIPEIGLAKDTSSAPVAVPGQPGVFELDIRYLVTNTGETLLNNVQVTDDLQSVLIDNPTVNGAPGNGADSFTIEAVSVDGFTGDPANAPTANPNYDGSTDQNLFTTDPNVFALGDTAIVTVTVQIDLSSDGVLETDNSAEAIATDPTGIPVSDVSQRTEDIGNLDPNTLDPATVDDIVDPDADGDPTNDNVVSPIQIPVPDTPQIGLAKAISALTATVGQPGFFDFEIRYLVTNTGNTTLSNVQITDDLQAVLIDSPTIGGADGNGADSFTVQSVTLETTASDFSGVLPTPNAAYDGNADQNLFTAAPNTFEVGDTAIITIAVRVDLSSDGSLETENSAQTTGVDPNGDTVDDVSQAVSEDEITQDAPDIVDPNGNGDPTDDNVPTPIVNNLDPSLVLVKRITNIFRQGVSLPIQGITSFQNDPTDVDTALRDAFAAAGISNQPAGLVDLPDDLELQPDDEVEYTIYFWNDGFVNLDPIHICDELEPPSILDSTTFALQPVGSFSGNPTFTGSVGSLIQARNPLDPIDGTSDPLESGCISNPGIFPSGPPGPFDAGGGVVSGPFAVPINQYGAVRFRVTLP